ncbi:MAG: FecR domain-containing protein [Gammaproteobacteria bacterium]|nr:FecR domain-containing protein [Gammaproteobacteria bacterium]
MPKAISNPSRNTNFLVKVSALIVLFSSLFLSTIGQASDSVGILKFAHGVVNIESSSGEKRKAVKGDNFMKNELVVTGPASIAVIQLNDDSRMTLRPNSAFRVNQLNMADDSNDSSSQQSAVLNLLRGGLRLVTGLIGKVNPARYRLDTPVATIGIRGTEFNTRLCNTDCAAEEKKLAGNDAAAKIKEGLYVNVDDGGVFLKNFATDDPLDLSQGESGYVADLNSLPVKLSLIPAFQLLDKIPSPSKLDFDDIEISDDALQADEPEAENAVVATAAASVEKAAGIDISGTYEIEVEYGDDLPHSDRKWFFGSNPDIEFTLTQKGDKIKGEFDGDRDGTIKGKIDDETVTFEFVLEAKGGEYKDGAGTWIVQDDGNLEGDFKIRDQKRGVIRGSWVLTKTD